MIIKWIRNVTFPLKIRLLAGACARLKRCGTQVAIKRWDIALLALAWGNLGYAAGFSYLRHVGARVIQSSGPILECGSGATTLLIGALTARKGIRFVVLEHNRDWYEYLKRILNFLGYSHVYLIHAPLENYGAYRWYRAPVDVGAGDIRLVICDGPPGSIQGGRYGLMPVMGPHLAPSCVILLDDTHREAERRIIDVWRNYRCLKTHRLGRFGTHTEVVFC